MEEGGIGRDGGEGAGWVNFDAGEREVRESRERSRSSHLYGGKTVKRMNKT